MGFARRARMATAPCEWWSLLSNEELPHFSLLACHVECDAELPVVSLLGLCGQVEHQVADKLRWLLVMGAMRRVSRLRKTHLSTCPFELSCQLKTSPCEAKLRCRSLA
mmetsp:Transcript_19559/g.44047  ORF Transcript_19559/g.44047 Transcript_19559/m.44047 type:complete len:108 (-) Transcript_19559:612-935(-)